MRRERAENLQKNIRESLQVQIWPKVSIYKWQMTKYQLKCLANQFAATTGWQSAPRFPECCAARVVITRSGLQERLLISQSEGSIDIMDQWEGSPDPLTQEGEEECHTKLVTTVTRAPEEVCEVQPVKTCRCVMILNTLNTWSRPRQPHRSHWETICPATTGLGSCFHLPSDPHL